LPQIGNSKKDQKYSTYEETVRVKMVNALDNQNVYNSKRKVQKTKPYNESSYPAALQCLVKNKKIE
jgi:hypothetical protein